MVFVYVDIVTTVTLVVLLLLLVLPKKVHYTMSGIILIFLGLLPFLYEYQYITFDYTQYPVLDFVIYFIFVIAGKDLFKEGIEEDKSNFLKYPSIVLGLFLIVFTSIPKLYKLHVIPFTLPEYPFILDSILYIVCGVFLLIGVVTLFGKK